MREYVIRRLLLLPFMLLAVSILVFLLSNVIPGDVVGMKLGQRANAADIDAIREQLGLNDPVHIRYFQWLGNLFRGDLGDSLWTSRPVWPVIRDKIPITAELAVMGILISTIIAVPAGVLSAVRQDKIEDHLSRLISVAGMCVPGFWLATMMITLPAIWWHWVPPLQYKYIWDDPSSNLKQMILPAIALGASGAAVTMRMTRSMMLEVLRQDYVRTARAKGLRERVIIYRHTLKNALIPVITLLGLQLGFLLGGTVIIEVVFNIPGLGRSTYDAVVQRDYPQLQANILFFAGAFMLINLMVDMMYCYLDPRIRYT